MTNGSKNDILQSTEKPKVILKMNMGYFFRLSTHRGFFHRISWGILAVLFLSFGLSSPVSAATTKYSATLVSVSPASVTLKAGQEKQITVTLKNTGNTVWKKGGKQYVSLYTWDPKYHASSLQASDWVSSKQTGVLSADVQPGKKGTITFSVKAPLTAGIYHENFQLAVESTAWISGGKFAISVTVNASAPVAKVVAPVSVITDVPMAVVPATGNLAAIKLLMSAHHLTLRGGERSELSVLYKNDGTAVWNTRQLVQDGGLRIAAGETPTFFDATWASATVAVSVNDRVDPGKAVFVRFAMRAPAVKGEYSAKFKLVVDDKDVPGSDFQIPMTVTDDAPVAPNPQPGPGISPIIPSSPSVPLLPEPMMRVGADTVPATVSSLILSSPDTLFIRDQAGNQLATVSPNVAVTVMISPNGVFQIVGASTVVNVTGIVRFVPSQADASVIRVLGPDGVTWSSWVNGARMRGIIEIRYYAPADALWVINELPMEKYLYGLGEMSPNSEIEYQKALITAARSYAYYHFTHPGKHVTFTVDASFDQVYRGYNRELNQPLTVQAVEATRGQIVHYNGVSVFTPYYANSDGRTRSYKEVWGADKGWLQSVAAIYDVGKKLFGHGVGMSARDAAYRAYTDHWTWDQLLKYYYTGIEIRKLW